VQCLVGIDDTDSSRGFCTTYLAYRIARDLRPGLRTTAYPRLVRLNPNVPFKTRGNAAVCLPIETDDADAAFLQVRSLVARLSDVSHGANSGLVFLDDPSAVESLQDLYQKAISGLVNKHRVEKLLKELRARTFTLGNGMGLVGAAASLAFNERFDHTYELIAYRRSANWGTRRKVDAVSVELMDRTTFPHTFNNYDYQKRKVLIAPHGPDPVFVGIRGDSPSAVVSAFAQVKYEELLDGYMVYLSNQHTDAHLQQRLDWKVYSSGWAEGEVVRLEVGPGGHTYLEIKEAFESRRCAIYEPTGDLRRAMRLLRKGDLVRVYGGVRRATSSHPKVLNIERVDVLSVSGRRGRGFLAVGTYVSSPRANRHLTKPLIRYGRESRHEESQYIKDWLAKAPTPTQAPARSR
jgi:tRNA(Ile2)-agmatinylcytidine synthase